MANLSNWSLAEELTRSGLAPSRSADLTAGISVSSVAHVINGLNRGGAETTLFRLVSASAVPARSHVISLTDEGYYGPRMRALGASVTCLRVRNPLSSLFAIARLTRLFQQLRPKVVQTWMAHANLIGGVSARLSGVPVVWGVRQANLSLEMNKVSTLATVKLCAWLSDWMPTRIVSCSRRAVLEHRAFGYAPVFDVIHNGIDVSGFTPKSAMRESLRKEWGVLPHEPVIGHVGRFDPHKDHETLFNACALLVGKGLAFRLVLCGSSIEPTNTTLGGLIDKYNLAARTILLGERSDVPELMHAMDLLVMSSVAEAFPNVVVEAMAASVPCVVTDVGDAAEIVAETGWVVPPRTPSALADAIADALATSEQERIALGEAARERVQQSFSVNKMVSSYERLWADVSTRRP